MNTRLPEHGTRGHDPQRDAEQREWALQERAMQDVRENAGLIASAPATDPDVAAYRRISQALRTPPPDRLPSNFAFQVAQLAARLPRASRLDLRLEQWLVRGLVTAMVLGGCVVASIYGIDWMRTLDSAGPSASGWAGALAACLLLTWAMQGRWMLRGETRRR